MEPDVIDLAAAVSEAVPFVGHLGLQLEGTPSLRVRLPDDARLGNHIGTQHAGALYTAAETASGLAVLAAITGAGLQAVPVVVDGSIRYRRVARGAVTALASLRRADEEIVAALRREGRVELAVEVTLTDGSDTVVASANFTWLLREGRGS